MIKLRGDRIPLSSFEYPESDNMGMKLLLDFLHQPTVWTEQIGRALLLSLVSISLLIWYLERQLSARRRPRVPPRHVHPVVTALQEDAVGLRPRLDSERSVPSDPQQRLRLRSFSSDYFLSPRMAQTKVNSTPVDIAKAAQFDFEHEYATTVLMDDTLKSHAFQSTKYHGPDVGTTVYQTWTPPPSWAEAARQLLPLDIAPLQRTLRLDLAVEPATLTIAESDQLPRKQKEKSNNSKKTTTFTLSVMDFSTHASPPAEGGVLHLYVKDSPRSEWLEQTFESANEAAQFQMDLLAAQYLGSAIHNMYQVLEMIHRGSIATTSKEFVMHDTEWDQESAVVNAKGIAWDDVMRCLGVNFPRFRSRLHRMLVSKMTSSSPIRAAVVPSTNAGEAKSGTAADGNQNTSSGLQRDYTDKRLLLGPVDFFRLFVPILPLDALPECESRSDRMEQLLSWRKLVAQASVCVQSYAQARKVVNLGWDLGKPLPENYWKRRMGYDVPSDDYLRDCAAKDEYYEGLVSRNISMSVRNLGFWDNQSWWNFWKSNTDQTILSPAQGFTHVGSHVFQMMEGHDVALKHNKDPVTSIPSLRRLIERYPDLDFYVSSFFICSNKHIVVMLFVRSLPKGIDPKFDRVLDRFKSSGANKRDDKLELMIQYTIKSQGMSFLSVLTLSALNLFLRWAEGRRHVSQFAAVKTDRFPIAPVRLASLGETHHFGGCLQRIRGMPKNYVASTLYLDSKENITMASRILISYLEQKNLSDDIVDITFKIAGDSDEELPERPVATTRIVHCQPTFYPLSPGFIAPQYQNVQSPTDRFARRATKVDPLSLYMRVFVTDPIFATTEALARTVSKSRMNLMANESPSPRACLSDDTLFTAKSPSSGDGQGREISERASIVASIDPFEKAINELIEILADVRVPVRMESSDTAWPHSGSTYGSLTNAPSAEVAIQARGDLQQVPILARIDRSDILRFFVASGCSLKKTAVRIVESTAWRGLTFPIDTRMCLLELQNGQFFQQGVDNSGYPVFYFRNTCLGPWRKNEDALIAAVLHRLEASLQKMEQDQPGVRCTLIVIMGKPYRKTKSSQTGPDDGNSNSSRIEHSISSFGHDDDDDSSEGIESDYDDDMGSSDDDDDDETTVLDKKVLSNNPRISTSENWHTHTSKRVVERLVDLLATHYPERLHRALVVIGNGNTSYARTVVGSVFALTSFVKSHKTREKVKFLRRYKDLLDYVERDELVTLVGGYAKIEPKVFEC